MSIRAQFDPETGIMLQPGDEGYNENLIMPLPKIKGLLFDPLMTGPERAAAIRQAQAPDHVKAKEQHLAARRRAAASGEAIPAPIDKGYARPGSKVYASDGPREATRLAAIEAWGGGSVAEPPSASAAVAARVEREELAAAGRREAALDVLRRTSDSQRAKNAEPGTKREYWKA